MNQVLSPLKIQMRAFIFCLVIFAGVSAAWSQSPYLTHFVECVDYNPSTNVLTAYYGYNNTSTVTQVVPFGGNNFFQPSPNFRGQPTTFLPGVNHFVYSTTLDLNGPDQELIWTLNRIPVTATNNVNNYCTQPVTYQGRLSDNGNPTPTGQYDLQFELFDKMTGGTALATVALEDVQVTNGIFTVALNFQAGLFSMSNGRFLQISVRPGISKGTYSTLTPRQELTAAPYAVASGTAVDAQKFGGLGPQSYVRQNGQGNVSILRPTGTGTGGTLTVEGDLTVAGTITGNFTLPPGSPNYIQNTGTQQATSQFNISGNGVIGGNVSIAGSVTGDLRINGSGTGKAIIGNLFSSGDYTGISLNGSTAGLDYNILSGPTDKNLYINRPGPASIQFRKDNVTQMTLDQDGNLALGGTVSSGCRSGFTAFAGGRLCVSATQTAATFYGPTGAVQTCVGLGGRVGTIADVTMTLSDPSFNYFAGSGAGWLGDYGGDNLRPVWNAVVPAPDFDGAPLNVYTGGAGGTAPLLPYRCVY